MDNLNQFNKVLDLHAIREFCEKRGTVATLHKGERFAEQGKVAQRWGIVTKGTLAFTIIDSSGNERIVGFAFAGGIVGVYASLVNKDKAAMDIVALSDCEVIACTLSDFDYMTRDEATLNLSKATNSLFTDLYSRYLDLYQKTPKERYLALIDKFPEILQYISLKQLASYLMITPVHLSRIRKELHQK